MVGRRRAGRMSYSHFLVGHWGGIARGGSVHVMARLPCFQGLELRCQQHVLRVTVQACGLHPLRGGLPGLMRDECLNCVVCGRIMVERVTVPQHTVS